MQCIWRLYSEIDCEVVVTGSYLGQALRDGYFLPDETVSYLYMFPLSFTEFCRIYEKEELLKGMDLFGEGGAAAYNELLPLYHIYRQIGGYPEVVRRYREKGDIESCYDVLQSLVETFKREFGYYFQTSKEAHLFKTVFPEAIKNMCSEKPCFSLYNQYELDFILVDKDNTVCGAEVKTKDGGPESLRVFIDRHLIDQGIVAKTARGGHGEKFDTIPVFTVGCRFPYVQE